MRRKDGKRGQGDTQIGVFYEKGEHVPHIKTIDGKPVDVGFPNDTGGNLRRTRDGYVYVNRVDARRPWTSNPATKPNYNYQKQKVAFKHVVNVRSAETQAAFDSRPDPGSTNHSRHTTRKIARSLNISPITSTEEIIK